MTPDRTPVAWLSVVLARLRARERSITTDAIHIYLLQGATLAVALLGNILVARVLGPAEKGRVDLFLLVLMALTEFGLFGIGSGLLYQLANRGRALSDVHGTGLAAALVGGGATVALGLLGEPLWARLFPGVSPRLIAIAFLISPFLYYRQIWSTCMTGINRARETYVLGLAITAGNLLGYGACWLMGVRDAWSVVLSSSAVAALASVAAFAGLRHQGPALRASAELARAAWATGWILSIGLLANALHFRLAQGLLNAWVSPAATGVFAVGARWAEMLFVLDTALVSAALYRISSTPDPDSAVLTRRLFRAQAVISGGAGVCLAALAWPIVHVLYDARYADAVWPLVCMIPGVVAWSLAKVLSQYLAYRRGHMALPTSFALLGLVVNYGLNCWWIPGGGIIGAAMASAVSYTLVLACTWVAFHRLAPRGA